MGGINNFALLRQLRDLLQSEDTQQFPASLNTDQIVVVVDLASIGANTPMPALQPFNTVLFSNSQEVDGLSSVTVTLFDHANTPALIDRDAKVLGVYLEIDGPADAADSPMSLYLQYGIGASVTPFYRLRNWEQTDSLAAWSREWALGGATVDSSNAQGHISAGWGGFLPDGQSLDLVLIKQLGTWPVGTTLTVRGIEVNVPTGARLPG